MSWIPVPVVFMLTVYGMRAQFRGPWPAGAGYYALAYWVNLAAQIFLWHAPQWVTGFITFIAFLFTWMWRKNRRDKRKHVLELIGAKSRAIRDALVRKLRQVRIRGVPRPLPA